MRIERRRAVRASANLGVLLICAGFTLLAAEPALAVNHQPIPISLVPAAATSGAAQVFRTVYSDREGARTVRAVKLLVNTSPQQSGGACVMYRRGNLYMHDGNRWRGGIRPGSASSISTAYGILYGAGTKVRRRGSKLIVRWHLGLRSPLREQELTTYLSAKDRTGDRSGWVEMGRWSLLPQGDVNGQILPADNPWNTDISGYPVHPDSADFISSIGASKFLHPDFGTSWAGAPNGIPYRTVAASQEKVAVTFYYPSESDPGPYPIPPLAPIEGGPAGDGDRHILLLDTDSLLLYELFDARRSGGLWRAGSGAIFDLTSNALRPDGWTSADAAGLPIFPGLIRYEEVRTGIVDHALRFTVSRTRRGYIHPATHFASSDDNAALPPMGLRLRLKGGYDISPFPPNIRVILQALKTYGMFVADNGGDWFLSGAPHEEWDDDELHLLKSVSGSAFEAVYTGPIITD